MKPTSQRRRKAGFTLIEVLLVLVILVVLVSLGITSYTTYQRNAYMDAARAQIGGSFKTALDAFHLDMGQYPSSLGELVQPSGGNPARWRGPYIEKLPRDPWDSPYQYQFPGQHTPNSYDLWSAGPDGTQMIGSWE